MKKEVLYVKSTFEVLKLKREHPEKIDDELLRILLKNPSFKEKEKIEVIKAANMALKIKEKEKLTDKKIAQKVLDNLK